MIRPRKLNPPCDLGVDDLRNLDTDDLRTTLRYEWDCPDCNRILDGTETCCPGCGSVIDWSESIAQCNSEAAKPRTLR